MNIVRIVLTLTSVYKWPLYQIDVYNVFLQGDLNEEVYMHIPEGFDNQGENNLVCKLRKSLYGLKQANMHWNVKLCDALINDGYSQSKLDYSLFTKHDEKSVSCASCVCSWFAYFRELSQINQWIEACAEIEIWNEGFRGIKIFLRDRYC